jgi:hypothetical protein
MINVLPLSIQPTTNINETNNSEAAKQLLLTLINDFEEWRTHKKNTLDPIPDELCRQIFSLEGHYSPTQLRSLFNLSSQQYRSKREKYFPVQLKVSETIRSVNNAPMPPPKLCEIKIKPDIPSPYAIEPLPSVKTLVVEFCRSDGHIMKIHTTQDSISTLMHTFFGEK